MGKITVPALGAGSVILPVIYRNHARESQAI